MRSSTTRACRCLISSLERVRFAGTDFPREKASAIHPTKMISMFSKFGNLLEFSTVTGKMPFASTAKGTISQHRMPQHRRPCNQASSESPICTYLNRSDMNHIRGICSTAALWKSPLEAGGKAKPYSWVLYCATLFLWNNDDLFPWGKWKDASLQHKFSWNADR